jgi:hypothetical protein
MNDQSAKQHVRIKDDSKGGTRHLAFLAGGAPPMSRPRPVHELIQVGFARSTRAKARLHRSEQFIESPGPSLLLQRDPAFNELPRVGLGAQTQSLCVRAKGGKFLFIQT